MPKRPRTTPRTTRARQTVLSGHRRDIEAYCDSVLDGKVVTGLLERAAVERYRKDLETAGARGLYLDWDEAYRSIDFIECLKHSTREYAARPIAKECPRSESWAEECKRLISSDFAAN
jgi:hypothetical protein